MAQTNRHTKKQGRKSTSTLKAPRGPVRRSARIANRESSTAPSLFIVDETGEGSDVVENNYDSVIVLDSTGPSATFENSQTNGSKNDTVIQVNNSDVIVLGEKRKANVHHLAPSKKRQRISTIVIEDDEERKEFTSKIPVDVTTLSPILARRRCVTRSMLQTTTNNSLVQVGQQALLNIHANNASTPKTCTVTSSTCGIETAPVPVRGRIPYENNQGLATIYEGQPVFCDLPNPTQQLVRAQMNLHNGVQDRLPNVRTRRSGLLRNNLYNAGKVERTGLRTVVIDGSNVAHGHSNGRYFSVEGLKICIDYFLKKGHKVKAFVPQFRVRHGQSSNQALLNSLVSEGYVLLTPARKVNGRRIVSYDDWYIVQCAAELEGVIVSNDNYRDLARDDRSLRSTIEQRLLMPTWVDDMIIFPKDPLGRRGPSLDRFLKFP